MRTALISVYHKDGIEEFAERLLKIGDWQILASGGTAKHLQNAGIPVKDVAELVGEPILGHRVVTLSQEIHAALMAEDTPEHQAELDRIGMPHIDLVDINLYPLEDAIKEGKSDEEIRELTDVGGPTLLRSAAKGRRFVISASSMRAMVLEFLENERDLELTDKSFRHDLIQYLAARAERTVARYCIISAQHLFTKRIAQPQ